MSWKTALYDYVHAKNQAELHGSIEPIHAVVADNGYLQSQESRLRQLRIGYQERGATPLRSETKLRISGIKEMANRIIAEIELRRTLHYRIGSREHVEERIEPERVTLETVGGKWRIRQLEARSSEKTPPGSMYGPWFKGTEGDDSTPYRLPSLPYINHSILNSGESLPRKIRYDRSKAVEYAETWWNGANPKYLEFEVDCTNFVSQCLFAGGAPMDYTGKRESGWWYAGKQGSQELWSFSWAVAHKLQTYISSSRRGLHGFIVQDPRELRPGDTISYDWDGDGRFQHNTIVTALDANGMPLVNAHTYNCRHRYWDYRDSPAWTEQTRYVFVRIADMM